MARSRQYRGDEEHQGDQQPENRHAGDRAPVPPVYGSGRPAFSPPTVLRGRGRIFPAPARGTSTPMVGRAISVPLAPVTGGLSRSVAEPFQCRPGRYEARTVQLPKLTVHEVVARRITTSCRDAEGEAVLSEQPQAVILVTGIQASGKSTIAQLLAERLPQSVHVRGDLFRRMIINGRADMTPDPASEAVRQLRLRHQLAATVSDAYFLAGFTVIVQDVILGAHLVEMTAMIRSRPLLVIVLAPQISIIADREQGRGKTAYGTWAIRQLDGILRNETPRLGLWLDTSTQTPAETTDEILSRAWEEARIPRQDR